MYDSLSCWLAGVDISCSEDFFKSHGFHHLLVQAQVGIDWKYLGEFGHFQVLSGFISVTLTLNKVFVNSTVCAIKQLLNQLFYIISMYSNYPNSKKDVSFTGPCVHKCLSLTVKPTKPLSSIKLEPMNILFFPCPRMRRRDQ